LNYIERIENQRRRHMITHFLLKNGLRERYPIDKRSKGFTLIELLVVIAVIGILAALLLSALSKCKDRALRTECLNNLRQFNLLLTMYADSNNQRFPKMPAGHWAWDIPRNVADAFVDGGTPPLIFYCPANGFTREDFMAQWDEFVSNPPQTNDYRVIGYAMTFPGTACVLLTNQNSSILPETITDTNSGIRYPPPAASERVLTADATISKPQEANIINRSLDTYVDINGAYAKPHRTAHINARYPLGGNLAMLDGHVEWRKFDNIYPRSDDTLVGTPVFWW
jgi:prepilin-type N-terminal cleavage/methylation domain-containing protein/prepilin-type processing-associated H-X9-DG protein